MGKVKTNAMITQKFLIMNSEMQRSEIKTLAQSGDIDTLQYYFKLKECKNKTKKELGACLINLDCTKQLKQWTLCEMQYQKSNYICKLPKLDYYECVHSSVQGLNMVLS